MIDIRDHGGNYAGKKGLTIEGVFEERAKCHTSVKKNNIYSINRYNYVNDYKQYLSGHGWIAGSSAMTCPDLFSLGNDIYLVVSGNNKSEIYAMFFKLTGNIMSFIREFKIADGLVNYGFSKITKDKKKLIITYRDLVNYDGTVICCAINEDQTLTIGQSKMLVDSGTNASVLQISEMLDDNCGILVSRINGSNHTFATLFSLNGNNINAHNSLQVSSNAGGNGLTMNAVDSNTAIITTRKNNDASMVYYYMLRRTGSTLYKSVEYATSNQSIYPVGQISDLSISSQDEVYYYVNLLTAGATYSSSWKFRIPKDNTNLSFSLLSVTNYPNEVSGLSTISFIDNHRNGVSCRRDTAATSIARLRMWNSEYASGYNEVSASLMYNMSNDMCMCKDVISGDTKKFLLFTFASFPTFIIFETEHKLNIYKPGQLTSTSYNGAFFSVPKEDGPTNSWVKTSTLI
ncbi:hypothetical protein [Mangrovibacillus cuniculi]|uniref:Uncharacterized protein n=1 Tax=Mangrovibacillus cuniculi TaxID=2593652 RepID=A0A7S8HFN7_9BACI|nr:hypothetical protein [Mangrovibacillus cuniculi]QPC47104.1 hypothetical protein G8O30_09060 [Mangrovibacillus cuniculi]